MTFAEKTKEQESNLLRVEGIEIATTALRRLNMLNDVTNVILLGLSMLTISKQKLETRPQ